MCRSPIFSTWRHNAIHIQCEENNCQHHPFSRKRLAHFNTDRSYKIFFRQLSVTSCQLHENTDLFVFTRFLDHFLTGHHNGKLRHRSSPCWRRQSCSVTAASHFHIWFDAVNSSLRHYRNVVRRMFSQSLKTVSNIGTQMRHLNISSFVQ